MDLDAMDRSALVAEVQQLRAWLDSLEEAAGFGRLDDVVAHQRARGWDADHETRLRQKRVDKLRALVLEESEWRFQVLNEARGDGEP